MGKVLLYAMQGEKMCFMHVMLNALDLAEAGEEVKVVFEGLSVKLPPVLAQEENPLYAQLLEKDLIAGVCKACSASLGVLEEIEELGLPLLDDMKGHAGVRPFMAEGYQVLVF